MDQRRTLKRIPRALGFAVILTLSLVVVTSSLNGASAAVVFCDSAVLQALTGDPSTCIEISLASPVNEADFPIICANSNCTRLAAALKALGDTEGDCVLANTTTKLQSGVVQPIVRYCSTGKKSDTVTSNPGEEDPGASVTSISVQTKRSNSGLITGIIIGASTVVLLLVIAAAWHRRNCRKNKLRTQTLAFVQDDLASSSASTDDDDGGSRRLRSSRDPLDNYRLYSHHHVLRSPMHARAYSKPTLGARYSSGSLSRYNNNQNNSSFGRISTTSFTRSSPVSSLNRSRRTSGATALSGGLWDDESILAARIPREDVVLEARISRGGYGEVYRGWYKPTDHVVAVKMLLRENRRNLRKVKAFLSEAKFLSALQHPQIVQFIGVSWDSLANLCTVFEFMDGGDLRTLLTRFEEIEKRPRGFDEDKARIALQVACALRYLHSLSPVSVLHRDLRSKNILLDAVQLNAKLTDFGGVSVEKIDCSLTSGVGTCLWTAPEVMLGKRRYSEKADVFSFGVVLSELDSHLLSYAEAKAQEGEEVIPDTKLLQMVARGELQVQFSGTNTPMQLVQLGKECVALDPQERPTAAQVLCRLQLALKQVYL